MLLAQELDDEEDDDVMDDKQSNVS